MERVERDKERKEKYKHNELLAMKVDDKNAEEMTQRPILSMRVPV